MCLSNKLLGTSARLLLWIGAVNGTHQATIILRFTLSERSHTIQTTEKIDIPN